MVILQALFALISKSAGKILNAIFGWAVRALFGRASAKEITFLSAMVAAAAAWPLLLVGLIAPKVASLLLAFVPIPHWVPSWSVRLVWLGLIIIVPVSLGITIASRAPQQGKQGSFLKHMLSGFPITIGLAIAFLIMFVTVPVMRLWAILRAESSADIPLITETSAYHQMAALTIGVLNRHGFHMEPARPGWWVGAPMRVLQFFGKDAFGAFLPRRLEHYEAPDLAASFYPSGVLLRGKGQKLTWAHGLVAEATARGDGFQTTSPAAQEIEKQIKRLWKIYQDDPEAHVNSKRLLNRVDEITLELGTADVEFEDWQVIYRQLLQLGRGLLGQRQLLDEQSKDQASDKTSAPSSEGMEVSVPSNNNDPEKKNVFPLVSKGVFEKQPPAAIVARRAEHLSTVGLVKEITAEAAHLAQKQIELAKTELRADISAEVTTIGGLGAAALAGLTTVNLLLMTAVLALARLMPGWTAGLLVSGVTMAIGAIIALVAWNKRVQSPLARTRRTIKEDLQWSKERLV